MSDVPKGKLWNEIPEGTTYPHNEQWYSHLLEQYKLYVDMADRISQRRTTANSYFLSINSAILGFVGYLVSKQTEALDYVWLLAVVGFTLTLLWYAGIISHRNINTAKWNVIHEIEKRLPISPYDAEWEAVGRGNVSALYRPISHVESGVPWIFAMLHLVVFAKTFPWSAAFRWISHVLEYPFR